MLNAQRFAYTDRKNSLGMSMIMPYLPLTLANGERSREAIALLDTGASVNVLPYDLGRQLGAVWEEQTVPIPLSGNLARHEARGLILLGIIASFPPVLFTFAWTRSSDAPVILGQMNFFAEFDVCFYRHELAFEVCPRNK